MTTIALGLSTRTREQIIQLGLDIKAGITGNPNPPNPSPTAAELGTMITNATNGLTVSGCDFTDLGKAQITLEPEIDAALVFGNRLREKQLITNHAGSCVQIGMNVVSRK